MSEQSFLLDFTRVNDFFEMWNIKFPLSEMGSADKFQIVCAEDSPSNIEDCISGGSLNNQVTIAQTLDCTLEWVDESIRLKNSVTWNIGDVEQPLKAIFIQNKASEYVMGYSINIDNFTVTNQLVFDAGTILWSLHDD